jgi:alpha-tubulin suppressor-like RCC1 family protein
MLALASAVFAAGPLRHAALAPRALPPDSVRSLAAGAYDGYAMTERGRVWSWGDNLEGQVGDGGPFSTRALPVQLGGIARITALAGGANSAFALGNSGTVLGWGDDSQGELGRPSLEPEGRPVEISHVAAFRTISAGAFSAYAIDVGGNVWAWGDNSFGQLGLGQRVVDVLVPRRVVRLTQVTEVVAGTSDAYALLRNGTVWAWGDNSLGELGGGCARPCAGSFVPVRVRGLTKIVQISAGGDSGYALQNDGSVWAWGDDGFGELGNGVRRLDESAPGKVIGLRDVVAITAGASTGYALSRDGSVRAWGRGDFGQLGDDRSADSSVPVLVERITHVVQVVGGGESAFALERNGSVWGWGADGFGQLGAGPLRDRDVPGRVLGLPAAPSKR